MQLNKKQVAGLIINPELIKLVSDVLPGSMKHFIGCQDTADTALIMGGKI